MDIQNVMLKIASKMPPRVTQTAGRAALTLNNYSPEILMGLGTVSMLGAIGTAFYNAHKIQDVVEYHKMGTEVFDKSEAMIKERMEKGEELPENLNLEQVKKDRLILASATAFNFGKVIFPTVILTGVSLTCFFAAHNIMSRRNIALASAYAVVDKAFKKYRERVAEELGEDVDRKFMFGPDEDEVVVTNSDGDEVVVKKHFTPSMYARVFDEFNKNFCKEDPTLNRLFLSSQQNYFNDLLIARGHVFLNEVHDALGLSRTKAGALTGWVVDNDGTDNFVDFGIFDRDGNYKSSFINGEQGEILLDFNVNGVIIDRI